MSSFLRKYQRQEKKNYKELYEIELNNRKIYEKRYKEVYNDNIRLQKETGLAELRKENMELKQEVAFLKEDRARLYIQLEDTRNEIKLGKDKRNGK